MAYETLLRRRIVTGMTAKRGTDETFGTFAETWYRTHVLANNKRSTQGLVRGILTRHLIPELGAIPLAGVTSEVVERYKASRLEYGLSAKGVNNHLGILGKCLRSAVEWDRLTKIPKIVLLKKPPVAFDFLEPEEGERLLEGFADPLWRLMALAALRTGLRFGELSGLRWEDVDLRRGHLVVNRSVHRGDVDAPKSWKTRDIPLSADLAEAFRGHASKTGYVFARTGEPVSHGAAKKAILKACRHAGLRSVGWHVLRHSFASQLASKGVPLQAVQELLGHSTITMTMRYAHLMPSSKQDAVSLLYTPRREILGQQVGNAKIESIEITSEKAPEKQLG